MLNAHTLDSLRPPSRVNALFVTLWEHSPSEDEIVVSFRRWAGRTTYISKSGMVNTRLNLPLTNLVHPLRDCLCILRIENGSEKIFFVDPTRLGALSGSYTSKECLLKWRSDGVTVERIGCRVYVPQGLQTIYDPAFTGMLFQDILGH